jgi:hypothetical protein
LKKPMETEIIAKVCHEVNRAFCEANGDHTQKSWEEADEWQKESTIKGVEFAIAANRTPEDQHEAWLKEKTEAGWVYGEIKDPEKKTHPYIIPFGQLPQTEKTKDFLFVAVVNALKDE